ncbi:hypothetical protein [Micromonospora pattaloongensis]|uniref:hypothetical protein n=1 Tax=Micromonospora pattaloongensis TaxID=405436 RepID=UPI000B8879AB|nr:hypothetical protein [Micromonospora pattaloongensis]
MLTFAPAANANASAPAANIQCRSNSKVFARGGATPASRSVTVRLCVERDDVTLRAWGSVSMGAKSGTADIVYHLVVNVRLEQNDADMAAVSCDATAWTNFDDAGGQRFTCQTQDRYSSETGGWTADGNVSYDLIGDGKNDLTWSLAGSPAIS